MTFNQWCGGKRFEPSSRLALEAIWNALINGGYTPGQISALFADLLDSFLEARR
jgi:hypothetical protein